MAKPKLVATTEFKIEAGIPMPPRRGGKTKYPWRAMQVGDSFFISGMPRNTVGSLCSWAGRRMGRRFTSRGVTEDGVAGIRIWRTE